MGGGGEVWGATNGPQIH